MKKHSLTLLAFLFLLTSFARAQAGPTATRGLALQAGGGFTAGKSDFSPKWITGFAVFANADFRHHIGVTFDMHYNDLGTPSDVGEITYLGGLRYKFDFRNRYHPYIKAAVGFGTFKQHEGLYAQDASSTYKIAAFGGGVEMPLRRHITLRVVDAEYQTWPHFYPNGLTPFILTTGVAYRF